MVGALALALVACSKGSETPADSRTGGPFEVLTTAPANNGQLFLNQSVRWTMSNPLNIDTATFNAIAFTVREAGGDPVSEQVTGNFRLGLDVDGVEDPYVLEFVPKLPTNSTFTNGGFKPARIYTVTIVQESMGNNPVLRDLAGNALSPSSAGQVLSFKTASGSSPDELFLDTRVGGPRVMKFEVGPQTGNRVSLNRLGTAPVEVRLSFNQPLNPSSSNVPVNQDTNPVNALLRQKGRIYLEYDDVILGDRQWIRAQVEMPVNDNRGAEVIIRPDGILPNNATIRVIVLADLQDISGESNVKDASYNPIAGTFATETSFHSQFDAVMMSFKDDTLIDKDAAFNDPIAEVKNGLLSASFDFEGLPTNFNYAPTSREIILNTNFTQVQPTNGPPIAVSGGVFSFNNIEIKQDVKVQGTGTNPLVFLANGTVRIDGLVSVNGGDGAQVNTLNSANFPTGGGVGVCMGGNGGKASQNVTNSTLQGETGWGPGQVPGGGGKGGKIACGSISNYAGGGGGGSMAQQGDDDFSSTAVQKKGTGGNGGTANATGGKPGPTNFLDQTKTNDFWGRLVTKSGDVIIGELLSPTGGGGGGGGGDVTSSSKCQAGQPGYINDRKGGGGGGGAGVVIIKALGPIIISSTGRVSADGGRGGGGEWAGSSRFGGGGGAGAGGMVVLMSATRIDLHTHQGTYANNDYNFSVTADGNISRVASYGSVRLHKYLQRNDKNNTGGYGGMGLVQLQTPPGDDADGTGTKLDDNLRVIQGANVLTGTAKTSYLIRGDIRPNPWFLASPYGRFSSAELHWRSTAASERRETVTPQSSGARVIDSLLGKSGPEWYFQQLVNRSKQGNSGYLDTDINSGALVFPPVRLDGGVTRAVIKDAQSNGADYHGTNAHVLTLDKNYLPDPLTGGWNYSNYRARLMDKSNSEVAEFRILSTSKDQILLEAGLTALPPNLGSVEILAKFLRVETGGAEGLGDSYEVKVGQVKQRYPKTNLQIGFAFHKDPSEPKITGNKDTNRFPQELGTFLYDLDLDDPVTTEQLRKLHYRFSKARIRFNLNYNPVQPSTTPGPNPVQPGVERPGIRFLNLPYRF